jgi:exosortase
LRETNRKFTSHVRHSGKGPRLQFENQTSLVQIEPPLLKRLGTPANAVLAIGCALLILPTMAQVARDTWSTEQGGHGPLVLATGMWALWRELKSSPVEWRPGQLWVGIPLLALCLIVFVVARITGVLEIEAFSMYGSVVAGAYLLFGGALIRRIWFPLIYLAFALPPPDTVVAAVTQPIKIAISEWAVSLLYLVGYPVANSGVIIQIGQYELLVAAACAGLNSIVTLTALCLFYVYLRHRSNPVAFLVVAFAAIPVAIISNFIRVLTLVLVTYYFGDAAAQGFIHEFAGLLMFAVALLVIFAIDKLASPLFFDRKAEEA